MSSTRAGRTSPQRLRTRLTSSLSASTAKLCTRIPAALRHQAIGQRLRGGYLASKHLCSPSGTRQLGVVNPQAGKVRFVSCVEHGFDIYAVGAKGQRLHRSIQLPRLANGGQRRKGQVQRRHAATVEASTRAECSFAREWSPRPLRVMCSIGDPAQMQAMGTSSSRGHVGTQGMSNPYSMPGTRRGRRSTRRSLRP